MSDKIKCQKCGNEIDISAALNQEFERKFENLKLDWKKKFEDEVEKKRHQYKDEFDKLEMAKKQLDETVKTKTNQSINALKLELEKELKERFESENSASNEALKKELDEKSKKISELNLKAVQIEILKREKDEMQAQFEAKSEKELNEKLKAEREKIKNDITKDNELKIRQKDDELLLLKAQIDELKRKSEIGSQQLQGEVQELAIQEWLCDKFPFDEIDEVKKGVQGADCIQIVHTRERANCGKIYYESKRTKNFSPQWIEKFKADMRAGGADIGVLVTSVLPKELKRAGMVDGIWICTYDEFKTLCEILRLTLIEISLAKVTSANLDGKMGMLYGYLTGIQFKSQVEAIVEAFVSMQGELEKEKNAMMRIWKMREKQIQKARDNAISMYASIRGIAGNEIGQISLLELEDTKMLEDESLI